PRRGSRMGACQLPADQGSLHLHLDQRFPRQKGQSAGLRRAALVPAVRTPDRGTAGLCGGAVLRRVCAPVQRRSCARQPHARKCRSRPPGGRMVRRRRPCGERDRPARGAVRRRADERSVAGWRLAGARFSVGLAAGGNSTFARCRMKAIVVADEAAGLAGMTLAERPEPHAAINDAVVQVHAAGFVPTEMEWPSTWVDRSGGDRTPSIPGHELAGVVIALGYGTTGVSVGQRVLGLADWHRDGTLAESVAIEARNLVPLPGDVDFTVGASLPISGLTAWQGLFDHGRLRAGQSVLAHGAAGAVGTMVTQLAREAGAYVIGTGRPADRQKALDFGAQEFVDLENDILEDVGTVDLVFDVIGGD